MENIDFKNKFWPSSYDGVQRFVGEIKNQLNLISNIRAYVKKRCKLYEVFIKELQKHIPSKEDLEIESCQPYSTLFIASLDSEIKKLNKTRLDGLHAIELLDKADQAYTTFKENNNKQYLQIVNESGTMLSLNHNIGLLLDSFKTAQSSLKKLQEENHKDQYTVDKQLKKIEKELSHNVHKREKIRQSFTSLVKDIIPLLKTLSIAIIDSINDFFHVWITLSMDLLIAPEDTNEINKALKSLSTVEALQKMLDRVASRGYGPRELKLNLDSSADPLIVGDAAKVDESEFISTKEPNLKKTNSNSVISSLKKPSENVPSQNSIPTLDADNISLGNKSVTSLPPSKTATANELETLAIQKLPIPPMSSGNSFFYVPHTQKPEAGLRGFDSDEDNEKKKNSSDDSDDPEDEPIHKFNIVIKPSLPNALLPQNPTEPPNYVPVIIPPSSLFQYNSVNRRNPTTNPSSQDKNFIPNPILGNSEKIAVSAADIVSTADIPTISADPKDLFPSSSNLFAKSNEKLFPPFNQFGSVPMFPSKSSDLLSDPAHISSPPESIAPKDSLFSNNIDFSTNINSQASYAHEKNIDKTDNSSLTQNYTSNGTDNFSVKNENPSISFEMSSISTNPSIENDQNLTKSDLLTTHNDMEDSSYSLDLFSMEKDPFSSSMNSLFNPPNSVNTKKYSISFKIYEILSCFTKQQMTKYSLKGTVTFSLSDEDVQTLASISSYDFPKLSFAITHNDAFTNQFSTANSLVEKTFKNEKSETIFNIDKAEFMLILNKFLKEHESDHFSDIPLLNYEISSPTFSVKPYSITMEPPLIEEKKVTFSVSIICAPLDAWCVHYPESSAVSKNAIVTLAANRIRSNSPLKIESLLPTNKYKWSPESSRLQWVIRELISNSKTSLSVSNYQFKIIISSESKIDLDDESKILGVAITFNLDNTLVSSKSITISDTSMFCLDNTQKKLSSGSYLIEV